MKALFPVFCRPLGYVVLLVAFVSSSDFANARVDNRP